MVDSEYMCPAEAEAYSRFSRDSGTYYVDRSRKYNFCAIFGFTFRKWCVCILLLLLLLLLVGAAAIYGYILYTNKPVKGDKVEILPVVEVHKGSTSFLKDAFPDHLCLEQDIEKTRTAVIVVGYEKAADGSEFWYVQPVGEMWHNHAKNATKTRDVVKISNRCFKYIIGFDDGSDSPASMTFF